MNQPGSRPGGLTALAVINFVFAGLGAIGLLALFALFSMVDAASKGEATKEIVSVNGGVVGISLLLGVVAVVLLIISGVGYLGMKRNMGRNMGNLYAIVAIVNAIVAITMMPGGNFGIGTIIGLVYPVLTLILLNTTFKQDLVR